MDCNKFDMLMADAWGGELTEADRPAFEAHLAKCERCRREYETGLTALSAMRSLAGPRQVRVERRGSRLILHDPTVPTRRAPGLLRRGLLRYAASVLIAFTAGYALHAGLMVSGLPAKERPVPTHQVAETGESSDESLEKAILTAHRRNAGRTNLAKCMIALFPPKG
jgi:anti-sigma factor RsiW